MLRLRFAPSPTGYLHIGSARTFIFNWLYARRHNGAMILRIDDTDLERNSQQSLDSIFEGLNWLNLGWDEQYRQSDRIPLHKSLADAILAKGLAYRDFSAARATDSEQTFGAAASGAIARSPDRNLPIEDSDARAHAGEKFVLRFKVTPGRTVTFGDEVYGDQSKSTDDIEDFALLRSDGMPTYHLASCADDVDLNITHIVRGQDHLTNTFKHVLIFEAAGYNPPAFAHLPLLVAPDGAKLSKRKHGPVVSVTTYRDAGFLPEAFINFLCLLGWSPKDDRERMSLDDLKAIFSFEGVNRSNAVVNFTEENPFDPKALWLNAEHIRNLTPEALTERLKPLLPNAANLPLVTPLIRERIHLLNDARTNFGYFFEPDLKPYDPAELIPKKGDAALALKVLEKAQQTLESADFTHDGLDAALRAAAAELGIKAGQMFEPIRVAVCGRKDAPPLFGTLEALGRETCLTRIAQAIKCVAGASACADLPSESK
jgi:glutamyl-tRNA synthetase